MQGDGPVGYPVGIVEQPRLVSVPPILEFKSIGYDHRYIVPGAAKNPKFASNLIINKGTEGCQCNPVERWGWPVLVFRGKAEVALGGAQSGPGGTNVTRRIKK